MARKDQLFSGEGGTGKSIIELMKNIAHVAGKDWLGSMPDPPPAFYLGAEDDRDVIHIRLAGIAKHYGVTFKELCEGGLWRAYPSEAPRRVHMPVRARARARHAHKRAEILRTCPRTNPNGVNRYSERRTL
jgi:AAA domain